MRLITLIGFLVFVLFFRSVWADSPNLIVNIQGLNETETKQVENSLSIKTAETEKKLTKERIENLHQYASQEIQATLEALGYYHASIKSHLTYNKENQCDDLSGTYYAEYDITLNGPTYICNVDIKLIGEGQSSIAIQNLISNTTLKPGMQLQHSTYEAYKEALLSKALQLGYLDAIYTKNEIQVDKNRYTANIYLYLDTGPRYAFGQVTFLTPPYPVEYLNRFIPFAPGTPYTTNRLLSFQKALTDINLFHNIRIQPDLDAAKNLQVPLNVKLTPKKQNRYTASIGFSTDDGLRGLLGWEHRVQTFPGHRINTEIRGSTKKRNLFGVQYTIPGQHPTTDKLIFGAKIITEKPQEQEYRASSDLSITQTKKWDCIESVLALHHLTESYREFRPLRFYLQTPTSEFVLSKKIRTHFLMPSLGIGFLCFYF